MDVVAVAVDTVDRETMRRAYVVEDAAALAQARAELSDWSLWSALVDPDGKLWAVERLAQPGADWTAALARARAAGRLAALAQSATLRGPGWRVALALVASGGVKTPQVPMTQEERRARRREQERARRARGRAARAAGAQLSDAIRQSEGGAA